MNRRSFFGVMAAAPAAVAAGLPGLPAPVTRVSTETGDPGEDAFSRLMAEGRTVRIFLNGHEIDDVCTADSALGYLKRAKHTAAGDLYVLVGSEEVATEECYGRIEIRLT